MREHLYRGKSVKTKEWIFGNYVELVNYIGGDTKPAIQIFTHRADPDNRWLEVFESEVVEVIPETVGQDTGLKDNNDIKIFEGDIIKRNGCFGVEDILIVNYNNNTCAFELCLQDKMNNNYNFLYCLIKTEKYEIIGNIYDNSELLNKDTL